MNEITDLLVENLIFNIRHRILYNIRIQNGRGGVLIVD